MNSEEKIQILLENTPFPGAGQEIGGHHVIESAVDLSGKNWAIYLRGKLTAAQAKEAVSKLTNTYFALPVQEEFSLVGFNTKAMTHARTNPPGDVTVVRGHMYYARPNPMTPTAFHKEMDEMLITNPEKHFTKYVVNNPSSLHDQLWRGVSYAGESYGWKKGNDLWHRRASFIMPKIKINKALEGATMFYHTHPAKDEPSLTSADDIQFYLDLHFSWGIKSFYTVMKHKLDHFTITGKAGGKEKYLRMEEDAFIGAIDGLITKGEEVAKKEVGDGDDIDFQNRITKEMVDLFNKKFKSIAKISFRPKRKNPASKLAQKSSNPLVALVNPRPNPPIKLEDKYVAKALEELKGLDYAHEHYGADEYGHTMYVYWWLKHHLAPTPNDAKGRLWKLNEYGLDSETRKKLRAYLSQPIIGNYNYMDGVYLLAVYHDIAKLREKGSKQPGWKIGADMFREEIGPELNLPSKLTEDLAFLFDTDLGRKGITDEAFLTQSGDYYGISKLVQMADMITHHPTMYTQKGGEAYKKEAMVQLVSQLRSFLDHEHVIQNPPPQVNTLQWIAHYGISDLYMDEIKELLGEYHQSVVPDDEGKTGSTVDKSSGAHIYWMRFNKDNLPGLTRSYRSSLALSSSKLTIYVGQPVPDDLGKRDANLMYQLVGERLKESYLELVIEEVTAPSIVNPRLASKIQVICISGPSGGGKSTVLRFLDQRLPNSSTPPTYTTRPRRPSDGKDRKFVTETDFKKMMAQGKFVEYDVHGGHFYGRVFEDFIGEYAIIEVSLSGKKAYEARFPNIFTVYLDPDPSVTEDERAKAIFKRGGLSKEEAKRRAKKAAQGVARSKKMQFDLRVTMMKGKYHEGARKVLNQLPMTNPASRFTLLEQPYKEGQLTLEGTPVPLTTTERNRNRQIVKFNTMQQAAYNARTHQPYYYGSRSEFLPGALLPPAWFHAMVGPRKYGLLSLAGQASLPMSNPPIESNFYPYTVPAILYHGTSGAHHPSIKSTGLFPRDAHFTGPAVSTTPDLEIAIGYAKKAAFLGDKNHAIVYEINVKKLMTTLDPRVIFKPAKKDDTDFDVFAVMQHIPPAYLRLHGISPKQPGGESLWAQYREFPRQNPNTLFTVKTSNIHGKGSYASKAIKKGTVVFSDGGQLRYLNHSDTPNILFQFPDEITGVAISNISKGEELTGDYQQLADLTGHPWGDKELEPHTLYNPTAKLTVRIEESTKPEKKLMAVFTKPNGRTKTTHFGARGMSDYTQHKDPKRKKNYLARHGGMGEDWTNPLTAGALSRWILWGKPSLRESFNDYKKKFNIEGVMAVTNTRANPAVTSEWGDTAKPVVLDQNLSSKPYTGNTKLPGRLPYQLVKKLRSLLARDREYVGFVKDNKIYYGTSFGVSGVSSTGNSFSNDAEFHFHTHPFGFRKGRQGTVSPQDMIVNIVRRMFNGVAWQLIIQKRGINIIRTSIDHESDLYKAMVAGNKGKWKTKKLNKTFDDLMASDREVIANMYNPKKPYRAHIYNKELKLFHPDWNDSSELKEEHALVNTCNKFVKGFNFNMWYLEVPSTHSDWSKEITEQFPLGDKDFSDVADYFKGFKQIRTNPGNEPHTEEYHRHLKDYHSHTDDYHLPLSNPAKPLISVMLNRIDIGLPELEDKSGGEFIALNFHPDAIPLMHKAAGVKMAKHSEATPGNEGTHEEYPGGYNNDFITINIKNWGPIDVDWKLARLVEVMNNKHGIETMGADQGGFDVETMYQGGEYIKHPVYYGFISCSKDSMTKLTKLFGNIPGFEVGPDEYFPNNPGQSPPPKAKNNPPRSRAFPWNKQLVQRSPLKTMKRAQKTLDSWKKGNAIGSTASSSLKSMGKIPRSDGKYEVGYVMNNPKAPGYNSYGWTTQDWRSIKVNSKGDIDYSEKCGAEGTRTKSDKPRLCLAAPIIRSLMKTESGKEVLRTQARKKLRAKKGERVPWHPRIKKLHKKLEERTPEDR